MFESTLSHKSVVFDYVKGNAGMELVLHWNANNKAHAAGGTTIKGTKNTLKSCWISLILFLV